ncbi:MAG: phosphate ABC transporter permease [Verrucomicrobia bacterium Tous-C9LFEB]|nr:MAG: phosphate ABC transporter permease [Verrucomicrobia bacterium Tous-C9LFEB]
MQRIVIEAGKDSANYWLDLWRYRELLGFLSWRDLLVRYKQTLLGVAWALLRPILFTFVFTLVFSKIGKFPSNGIPYALLTLTGVLVWQLFATAFGGCSASLVNNAHLITKVYFPRLILPCAAMAVGLVDFLVALVLLFVVMPFFGVWPDWRWLTLPFWIALALITAASAGIWIAALNVRYRDFGTLVPLALQLGMFISPVGYASDIVPDRWRLLYSLNPLVSVIDGFRWSLFEGKASLCLPGLMLSILFLLMLLWTGLRYFRSTEKTFADII